MSPSPLERLLTAFFGVGLGPPRNVKSARRLDCGSRSCHRRTRGCKVIIEATGRLSSNRLLILSGAALYHPGATLQVERCARDVAVSHTLPMRRVSREPYLLTIYPRGCQGRNGHYRGCNEKKSMHLEVPSRKFRGRIWGKALRRAAERMAIATATGPDDASATPWRGIALAASTPPALPALARRPRSTWLARS